MDYSNEQLRALAREFCPAGLDKDPVPLGNGHINDTFLFESEGRSNVLQRINRNVFREPEKVMENFQRVTEHIRQKVAREGGEPEKETLQLNRGSCIAFRKELWCTVSRCIEKCACRCWVALASAWST